MAISASQFRFDASNRMHDCRQQQKRATGAARNAPAELAIPAGLQRMAQGNAVHAEPEACVLFCPAQITVELERSCRSVLTQF
jgi:hypothetical protein